MAKLVDYLMLPGAEVPWIVQHLVPAGGTTLLFGAEKIGKSFLALQLAEAISCSRTAEFMGLRVNTHGLVLYLQLDMPRELFQERLRALQRPPAFDMRGLDIWDRTMLGVPYPFDICKPQHQKWLRGVIADVRPVAVLFDVLSEFHQGDENSTPEMRNVHQAIAATVDVAKVIVHHMRKPSREGKVSPLREFRGANVFAGRVDVLAALTTNRLYLKGRMPKYTFALGRRADGTWKLLQQLEPPTGGVEVRSVLSGARDMAEELQITIEAARSRLRRGSKGGPG